VIHLAAHSNSLEAITALLNCAEIEVDAQDGELSTALHVCALNGNMALVDALLAAGADPNIKEQ